MSSKEDIQPHESGWRRLSYTKKCGWVDWGHALPGAAKKLKQELAREYSSAYLKNVKIKLNGKEAFILEYGFAMGGLGLKISNQRHWVIQKGLTHQQKERVALAIFLETSVNFEKMQGSFPYSLISGGSSFSGEDLISNLIGFYSAFTGQPQEAMRRLCGEVTVEDSLKLWDDYLPDGLDSLKNKTLKPILFSLDGAGEKKHAELPPFLKRIRAEEEGLLWVKPKSRFIDGRLISGRYSILIADDGAVGIERPVKRALNP